MRESNVIVQNKGKIEKNVQFLDDENYRLNSSKKNKEQSLKEITDAAAAKKL
jgi:hypothetical protein